MAAFRVGVIGCGFFGRFHLQSWRELATEGVEIAAVCDADATRTEATAAEFDIARWYSDPAALLAEGGIDLVDIATRMDTHRALVEAAVAAGIPTVVQKPMGPVREDCLAMVEAAEKAGVFFAVHENFRFQAPMVRVREIIGSGEIGTPTWARIAFRTGLDVYRNQPYFYGEERLVILDLGIHLLDLARVLLGEVERVSCETQRRNDRVKAEDTATMLLRHRSGAVSLAECTYENRRSDRAETLVEIEASDGGIDVAADGVIVVTTRSGIRREQVPKPALAWAAPPLQFVQGSVLATCRHMLQAVREGRDAETSGRDNLKTYALVEAAYQAAASGCSVGPAAGERP